MPRDARIGKITTQRETVMFKILFCCFITCAQSWTSNTLVIDRRSDLHGTSEGTGGRRSSCCPYKDFSPTGLQTSRSTHPVELGWRVHCPSRLASLICPFRCTRGPKRVCWVLCKVARARTDRNSGMSHRHTYLPSVIGRVFLNRNTHWYRANLSEGNNSYTCLSVSSAAV